MKNKNAIRIKMPMQIYNIYQKKSKNKIRIKNCQRNYNKK